MNSQGQKGTAVKRDEGETNHKDVEVDRHYFGEDGDVAGDSRLLLGKVLAGCGRTVARQGHRRREESLKIGI